jgi:ATP-dependent DNA helicase RecG
MNTLNPNLTLLHSLISEWENECVEFKEANDNFSTSDIGKYFSALSNEANLRNRSSAWLVFGVNNKTRETTGTTYRSESERLYSLKKQITDGTGAGTFREIHEVFDGDKRILLFEILPAPRGLPFAWSGHYYARSHESLTALSDEKRDEIRSQTMAPDWSAVICQDASISDLHASAILKTREAFTAKHSGRIDAETIAVWSDSDFLDRAGVTISGHITRAAILLLGKPESTHFISPYVAEMTWKLEGEERAYEHFHPPFILTSSLLYQRIRNLKLTLLRPGDLIAFEVPKYDQRIILEALHNCIAHQDYTRAERIVVTEKPHELIFQNAGSFIDGTPEDYITTNKTPTQYRNRFLTTAMVNLRMIDKMGFGIHDVMFRGQAKRFLPLPEYDSLDPAHVTLTLPGRFLDENYSKALMAHPDLGFPEIMALDLIQKGRQFSEDHLISQLKKKNLIEGRKPNFHVTSSLALSQEQRADYIKNRAFDDPYYCHLILNYLKQYGRATRSDLDMLLREKLSATLSEPQKTRKIGNLIQKLKHNGEITLIGKTKQAVWILVNSSQF